jgi:hypothetical protein
MPAGPEDLVDHNREPIDRDKTLFTEFGGLAGSVLRS